MFVGPFDAVDPDFVAFLESSVLVSFSGFAVGRILVLLCHKTPCLFQSRLPLASSGDFE